MKQEGRINVSLSDSLCFPSKISTFAGYCYVEIDVSGLSEPLIFLSMVEARGLSTIV